MLHRFRRRCLTATWAQGSGYPALQCILACLTLPRMEQTRGIHPRCLRPRRSQLLPPALHSGFKFRPIRHPLFNEEFASLELGTEGLRIRKLQQQQPRGVSQQTQPIARISGIEGCQSGGRVKLIGRIGELDGVSVLRGAGRAPTLRRSRRKRIRFLQTCLQTRLPRQRIVISTRPMRPRSCLCRP